MGEAYLCDWCKKFYKGSGFNQFNLPKGVFSCEDYSKFSEIRIDGKEACPKCKKFVEDKLQEAFGQLVEKKVEK